MQRIVVVGAPGSGKTTTSTEIAGRLGLPRVEIDALHWEPGWTEAAPDLLRDRLRAATAGDRWVVDGNYFSVGSSEIVWPRADTIVFLDLPRRTVVRRVLTRTTRRVALRTELWSGNRETTWNSVFATDSIVRFAWNEYPKYPARYRALMRERPWSHLEWVHLRSPSDVRRWLLELSPD